MAMSDKTRVLILAHVFPRSLDDSMGAFLLHLAQALAACDVSTTVVAPHAAGLGREPRAAGLAGEETLGTARVHRFRYAPARWERLAYTGTMHELVGRGLMNKFLFVLFNLAFLVKTIAVIRATKPAVLHAHWWLPDGLVGALAALVTRVPLVITTHGTDVEMLRLKTLARPLARFVFARARAITCGSTYLRDQLLGLGVADPAQVVVIPMPVNPLFQNQKSKVTLAPPARAGESQKSDWVLTVARLTKQKSIETLIDAMAILRERGRGTRLVIIGDGPERPALEERARRLDLQDRVEFLGTQPQSELPLYYANCAVFVLPSVREGMGLVLAEALLCGAPVIAARSGGVIDIVKEGETGLLVPEREPAALAEAIEKLVDDRELAARLVDNGRAWVRERYTPAGVAARFADIYRSASGQEIRMPESMPPEPPEELREKSAVSNPQSAHDVVDWHAIGRDPSTPCPSAGHSAQDDKSSVGWATRNDRAFRGALNLQPRKGTSQSPISNLQSPISILQSLTPKGRFAVSNLHLRRVVGYVLALAALYFLGRLLVQTWGQLAETDFRFEFDWPRLVVSLALLVVARAFAVEAWRRILISLGAPFGFAFGARVWFLSNLTRYIPGNIWQVATMMTLVEQRGVSKTNALLSQVIYAALALSIAGLLGVGFFLVRPAVLDGLVPPEVSTYAPFLVAAALVALLVFFALAPVNRLIVQLTARLTRRPITAPTPTFARGLVPPLFSLAMWLTNGVAFYLFVSSVVDLPLTQLPAFIAMNAGAYWIGYVSFVTPSGLGFREGALAWMLASLLPTPVAIALSLVARLWTTAGELLGVVLAWSVPEPKPSPAGPAAPEGPQTP
jgi:glycosyltransferase involved in cell wall biosynthesis